MGGWEIEKSFQYEKLRLETEEIISPSFLESSIWTFITKVSMVPSAWWVYCIRDCGASEETFHQWCESSESSEDLWFHLTYSNLTESWLCLQILSATLPSSRSSYDLITFHFWACKKQIPKKGNKGKQRLESWQTKSSFGSQRKCNFAPFEVNYYGEQAPW